MVRQKKRLAALVVAFKEARSLGGGPLKTRYPLELKQMAVDAIHQGFAEDEVREAAGVSKGTLVHWHKQLAKKRPGKARRAGFRQLKVVGEKYSARGAVLHLGKDMHLEIPAELLSAALLQRLTGSDS